jgi:arylsulfatase A-like enzyme
MYRMGLEIARKLVIWIAMAGAAWMSAEHSGPLISGSQAPARRNVIVFVADGLRYSSVNEHDTPAMWSVRANGVDFANTSALFPTFTLTNAAALATGHHAGDTGVYSNYIWAGAATFDTGNFSATPGTPVPFLENDRVLADLVDRYGAGYLGERTLLSLARDAGYRTAAVGKVGPIGVQDIDALIPVNGGFTPFPPGIMVDDATGSPNGSPLPPALLKLLAKEGLPVEASSRSNGFGPTSPYNNGYGGDRSKSGTLLPNVGQQQWFADVTTRAILPAFAAAPDSPFLLIYWSRDPDGTQHYEGDSLNMLAPGINGPTATRGVQNADRNLAQILAWLDAHPASKDNTDVFVTADHGFATISRREIDRSGRTTASEAARHDYVDASGKVDTVKGTLPLGFLAIDLASSLGAALFDPDQHPEGSRAYKRLSIDPALSTWEHPLIGQGLIGGEGLKPDGSDARAIVAASGGTDIIYVPDDNPETVQRLVSILLTYDYVGSLFVDDEFGPMAGTLPFSAIGLSGASKMPKPAIVVPFKTFYLNPDDLRTAVMISDTGMQTGQGMHGGFGRDNTYMNVSAIGPDFKKRFVDPVPFGNADVAPTIAQILGISLPSRGKLSGRAATEALATGGPAPAPPPLRYLRSAVANGKQALLVYQEYDGRRYLYASCFVDPQAKDDPASCR